MQDVVFLAVILGLVALMMLLVNLCDRLVEAERPMRRRRERGDAGDSTTQNWVGEKEVLIG